MACFINLRSDYPLNLTLFKDPYACTLTWFYIAGFTSARTIPLLLIRHNHPVPVSFYTGSCANFCSSACAPSTGGLTCRLTPAWAAAREFRPRIDKQVTPPVEHRCANLRDSTELDSRELASLLSPKSAACVVVEVADNHSFLSGFSDAELDGGSALRIWHYLACLFVDSRASQIRSTKEEHMMSQSRGAVRFEPLFTAEDIGL